jgi:pimeloyl-ACP methyl ester carboxylesterase
MPVHGPNGFQADYVVTGDGPPIVMTHSFLADRSMWREQREPLLEQGWQLIEIDLPGHGGAPPVAHDFAIEELADLVVSILDAESVPEAVWCGLSIGGMLSQRAALHHPDRVRALVLADTSASPEPLSAKVKYRAMAWWNQWFGLQLVAGQVTPLMFGPATRSEQRDLVDAFVERTRAMDRPSIRRYVTALVTRSDITGAVSGIDKPTLVIVGEHDKALPEARSRALAASIAGARYEVVPDAGHLSPLERPDLFNPPLLDFLEPLVRG